MFKKDHLPGGFSIDLFLYLGKSEICKKSRSPEKEKENLEKESEKKPLMEPVATLVGSNEAPSVVVSVLPDTQEWRVRLLGYPGFSQGTFEWMMIYKAFPCGGIC